jgi:hypothetical protein
MSTQHVEMEAGASTLATNADAAYFSGLRELTSWSERDRQLKQTGKMDATDHLMEGFRVLERISQIASEAVSSYDAAIANTQPANEVARLVAKRARYTGTAKHLGTMFEQLGRRITGCSTAVAGKC